MADNKIEVIHCIISAKKLNKSVKELRADGTCAFVVLTMTHNIVQNNNIHDMDWKCRKTVVKGSELKALCTKTANNVGNIRAINFTVTEDGKIKGLYASLDRIVVEEDATSSNGTCVIVSELVNSENSTVGYKIANVNGIDNVRVKDVIAMCKRFKKKGIVPIQNAMFVDDTEDVKAHIKKYPHDDSIMIEVIPKKKINTQVKRVDSNKNEQTLKKDLTEIYSAEQIEQLALGKKSGINIVAYANPSLSAKQMEALRCGLEGGVNVSKIAFPQIDVNCMKMYMKDMKAGLKIDDYINPKYTLGQLCELSLANELGLDYSSMLNPDIREDKMAEIRERLEMSIYKRIGAVMSL